MADETDLCWVNYNFLKISLHRKNYVKKCEQCDGKDVQCRAYIPQSYFSKPLSGKIKKPEIVSQKL